MRILAIPLLLFPILLTACSATTTSTDSGPTELLPFGDPTQTSRPGPAREINCDEVITQAVLDQFNASHPVANIAGLVGSGQSFCQKTSTVNGLTTSEKVEGFSFASAVPTIKFLPPTSDPNNADLPIEVAKIQDLDLISAVEALCPLLANRRVQIDRAEFKVENIALGGLPEMPVQIYDAADSDKKMVRVIRPDLDVSLVDAYRAELKSFTAGYSKVELEFANARQTGVARVGSFGVSEQVLFNKLRLIPAGEFLASRWSRITKSQRATLALEATTYAWMNKFLSWWPFLKLDSVGAQTQFSEAFAIAQGLWKSRQAPVVSSSADLLTSLRFLLVIEPNHTAKSFIHYAEALFPYLSSDSSTYFNQVIELTNQKLTSDQEKVLFDTISKLRRSLNEPALRWNSARSLCASAGYNQDKINTIFDATDWMKSVRSEGKLSVATEWVTKYSLTAPRLALLKHLYAFFYRQLDSDGAFMRSVQMVVIDQLPDETIASYQATYTWVYKTLTLEESLAKADLYLLKTHLTPEDVDLLKTAYTWLYQRFTTDVAFAKAEDYLLKRKMTQAQYAILVTSFNEAYRTSAVGPALTKAEKVVFGN